MPDWVKTKIDEMQKVYKAQIKKLKENEKVRFQEKKSSGYKKAEKTKAN